MASPKFQLGNGNPLEPRVGIVPILHETGHKTFRVVGTGFYITRYGLVATARHVVEELLAVGGTTLSTAYVLHHAEQGNKVCLRQIRRAFALNTGDVAVVQADNYLEEHPTSPLKNRCGFISIAPLSPGEPLTTYGYPENATLDFNLGTPQLIKGDYFQGYFSRLAGEAEHPFLRFPHFESTVEIRSGASGGPVFNSRGSIVAINCSGWDFRGGPFDGDNLSYLIPIAYVLNLEVDTTMVDPKSWEASQMPPDRIGKSCRLTDLARWGHLLLDE